MDYKDYYKVLGVSKTATAKEIKSAYRKLAQQYHPDRNPGDKKAEARFKEINEAYEVLDDADKRKKYDELGSNYAQWERMGRPGGGFDFSQWATGTRGAGGAGGAGNYRVEYQDLNDLFGNSGFSDFFETLFGGSGMGRTATGTGTRVTPRAAKGQNLEQPVEISLEEAYHGATRVLQRDGARRDFKIPPGVKTGTKVRFPGEGQAATTAFGGAAPNGDLFLVVTVRPHPRFRREGDDLHLDLPVSIYTALLGGEVRVATLNGDVMLNIPPETQGDSVIRLTGRGMPLLRQPQKFGDMYAHVTLRLPGRLTEAERELVRQLAALHKESH